MSALGSLRRRVRFLYATLGNWRAVGRELGISSGMAFRLANERGYEPKGAHVRVRLGLPAMAPAPVCERCGEVHVSRRCTKSLGVRVVGKWRDLPVDVLRWAIENREDYPQIDADRTLDKEG